MFDAVSGHTVLQVEDIALVENVQRGMGTPAFTQGRIVYDPQGSGRSEHAVHHFHGLVLKAYKTGRLSMTGMLEGRASGLRSPEDGRR